MNKKLISVSILGVVLAVVLAFGMPARAADNQIRVDRDFGEFSRNDVNRFGDDRAYSSTSQGTDRDADYRLFKWTPNTYGLGGDYGYDNDN